MLFQVMPWNLLHMDVPLPVLLLEGGICLGSFGCGAGGVGSGLSCVVGGHGGASDTKAVVLWKRVRQTRKKTPSRSSPPSFLPKAA